jgi:hypothetical protein
MEDAMPHTAQAVGELVSRIQEAFLDTPGLALTTADAEARFALDASTCAELLDFLAEAGVLARDVRDGQHAFLLRRGDAPLPGPRDRISPLATAGRAA